MTNGNERLAVVEVHVQHNTDKILDHARRLTHIDQRINSTERWIAGLQSRTQLLPEKVDSLTERQDKNDRTMERIRITISIIRGASNTALTTILVGLFLTGNLSLESAKALLKLIGIM